MTRRKIGLLLAAAATVAVAAPASAQMDHSNMPGMKMPMPAKPAAKKPVAKKPVAKKPAARTTAAKKAPARKSVAPKAATTRRSVTPAVDPHAGHDMSKMAKPGATPADPMAGHDMSKMAAPGASPAVDPMAGHDMSKMAPPGASAAADPMAGHDMNSMAPAVKPDAQPADPHAGHDMGSMPGMEMPAAKPADPMAGHDMSSMPGMSGAAPSGTDLAAGNAPPPEVPTDHAGDIVYGASAMEMGRHHLSEFHGGQKFSQIMFNIAEAQFRNGRNGFEWDGEGWYGGDINRLWIKSEGETEFGRGIERAEVQALYSRAIGPYFNLQGGLRYDFKPNPSRVYATFGFEGLAPSFFDVEGAVFLSNKGEVMARLEGYYDQRITQRLILQPRAEFNFAAQNSRQIGVGAGLSDAEVGLRLRYDIRREFAPYVGVQYRQAFGKTRQYLRDEGEKAGGLSLVAGVRVWF